MGWYRPHFGPDAGRLVWRDAGPLPPAAPPDEAALDVAIPGRAAIREGYAPTHAAVERGRRGAEAAAQVLYESEVAAGGTITRDQARERVNTARSRSRVTRAT